MQPSNIVKRLISHFGTQAKFGEAMGVKQGTVNGWLHGKHGISEVNALKIEKLTHGKFKAYELCPKLAEFAEQLKSPKRELGADSSTKRKSK